MIRKIVIRFLIILIGKKIFHRYSWHTYEKEITVVTLLIRTNTDFFQEQFIALFFGATSYDPESRPRAALWQSRFFFLVLAYSVLILVLFCDDLTVDLISVLVLKYFCSVANDDGYVKTVYF